MDRDLSERIKKDFIYFSKKMDKMEVNSFLKCSFLFRSGLYKLSDIDVFGTSLFIPLYGIDTEIPMLIWRYYENKVHKHTGIDFLKFKELEKIEQEDILTYAGNIEILERDRAQDVVDNLNIEGEASE